MADFTIRDLLEAGTHFGHQTRRWNPSMRPFIFTERNGIHIIDLQKTVAQIQQACELVRQTARSGRAILFVATKKQAGEIVKAEAERCGQYYVTERWLGGMLTNWGTIRQSIRHLDYLDRISQDGTYEKLKKKEVLVLEKERDKLKRTLTGIRQMGGLPGLVYIVDIRKEHIAVKEAAKLEVPSVAIVDTNCDPDSVTCPVPGNDDAIRSISLITRLIADAALEGRAASDREQQGAGREQEQDKAEAPHAEGRQEEAASPAAR